MYWEYYRRQYSKDRQFISLSVKKQSRDSASETHLGNKPNNMRQTRYGSDKAPGERYNLIYPLSGKYATPLYCASHAHQQTTQKRIPNKLL